MKMFLSRGPELRGIWGCGGSEKRLGGVSRPGKHFSWEDMSADKKVTVKGYN